MYPLPPWRLAVSRRNVLIRRDYGARSCALPMKFVKELSGNLPRTRSGSKCTEILRELGNDKVGWTCLYRITF